MSVNSVVVRLLTIDQMSAGLTSAGTAAEVSAGRINTATGKIATGTEASASRTAVAAGKIRATIEGMAGSLGAATGLLGTYEIGKSLISAGKDAITFQDELVKVHNLAGASMGEVAQAQKDLIAMSPELATSPVALADAWYHAKSIGLDYASSINLVDVAAKGAKIGHADLTETTNALTGAVQAGLVKNGEYAAGMQSLLTIVGTGDMAMGDLTKAFGTGGLLANMANYGVTLKDVGAGLAVFGDNNLRGAAAATALRMATQELVKQTGPGEKVLADIGIQAGTLTDIMSKHGLNAAVTELVTKMHAAGIESNQVGDFMLNAFGKKGGGALGILVNEYDLFQTKIKNQDDVKSLGEAWAKTTSTAGFQLSKLGTEVKTSLMSAMMDSLPAISKVAWFLGTEIPRTVANLYGALKPTIEIIGGALVVAGKAAGGTLLVVFTVINDLANLIKSHETVFTTMATVLLGLWAAGKGYTILKLASTAMLDLGRSAQTSGAQIIGSFTGATQAVQVAAAEDAAAAEKSAAAMLAAAEAGVTAAQQRVAAIKEVSAALAGQDAEISRSLALQVQAARGEATAALAAADAQKLAFSEAQAARIAADAKASSSEAWKREQYMATALAAVKADEITAASATAAAQARLESSQVAAAAMLKETGSISELALAETREAQVAVDAAMMKQKAVTELAASTVAANEQVIASNDAAAASGSGLRGIGKFGGGKGTMLAMGASMAVGTGVQAATDGAPSAVGGALTGAASGAVMGAMMGSMIGPEGTVIGAGVGAVAGGALGYFSAKKAEDAAASKSAAEQQTNYNNTVKDFTSSLTGATGALTQKSAAILTAKLQDDGALDTLKKYNISVSDFVLAAEGKKDALARVNKEIDLAGQKPGTPTGGTVSGSFDMNDKAAKQQIADQMKLRSELGLTTGVVNDSKTAYDLLTNAKISDDALGIVSLDSVAKATGLTADQVTAYAKTAGLAADSNGQFSQSSDEVIGKVKTMAAAYQQGDTSISALLTATDTYAASAKNAGDKAAYIGAQLKAANGDALDYASSMNGVATATHTFLTDVASNAAQDPAAAKFKDASDQARTYLRSLVDLQNGTIDYTRAGSAPLINDLKGIQSAALGAASATYQHELATVGGKKAADDAYDVYVKETRGALLDQAKQLGLTSAEAKKLADKYFGMPKDVKTQIEATGTNAVVTVIDKLGQMLAKVFHQKWVMPAPDVSKVTGAGKAVTDQWAGVRSFLASHPGYVMIDPRKAQSEASSVHAHWITVGNQMVLTKPKIDVLSKSAISNIDAVGRYMAALPANKQITITVSTVQEASNGNANTQGGDGAVPAGVSQTAWRNYLYNGGTDPRIAAAARANAGKTVWTPPKLPDTWSQSALSPANPANMLPDQSYAQSVAQQASQQRAADAQAAKAAAAKAAADAAAARRAAVRDALNSIKATDLPGLNSAIASGTIASVKSSFTAMFADLKKAGRIDLLPGLRASEAKVLVAVQKRITLQSQLATAQAHYNDLVKQEGDLRNSISGAITKTFDITTSSAPTQIFKDKPAGTLTAGSILNDLRSKVAKAQKFGGLLAKLKKEGLAADLIQQLAEAGPGAYDQAAALAAGTPKEIAAINAENTALKNTGNSVGASVAKGIYGGQEDVAKALINGFNPKDKKMAAAVNALAKSMFGAGHYAGAGLVKGLLGEERSAASAAAKLGASMTAALKHKLGIASPSKVGMELGANFGESAGTGIANSLAKVKVHAGNLADAMVPKLPQAPNLGDINFGGGSNTENHVHYHTEDHSDRSINAHGVRDPEEVLRMAERRLALRRY